jgi:hypothetical protein
MGHRLVRRQAPSAVNERPVRLMIMATSTDTLCIHCNAVLTPCDLSDGWCDSCGKRLPGGPRRASATPPAATPAASAAGGAWKWVVALGGIAFALLGAAAAMAVAG